MKYSYSNFHASINKMPKIGEEGRKFIAKVEVQVPKGGHTVSLVKDHVAGDTIYMRIDITPPQGIATMAITTLSAHYEESLSQEYKEAVLMGVIDETGVSITH